MRISQNEKTVKISIVGSNLNLNYQFSALTAECVVPQYLETKIEAFLN